MSLFPETQEADLFLRNHYFYSRDARGKIRITFLYPSYDGFEEKYIVEKDTGTLVGKWSRQPTKIIDTGKAKRTLREQFELELKSMIKKIRDKGYKELVDDLKLHPRDFHNEAVIEAALPMEKTTGSGFKKPMLAQEADKQLEEHLNRTFLVSYKLDGIRTTAHLMTDEDGNDKLAFKSRNGEIYKGVATHFENDVELINLARTYEAELDGEFYVHGLPLNVISGDVRSEVYDPVRHDHIEFHMFDLALPLLTAEERADILNNFESTNPRVKVVEHVICRGPEEIDVILQKAISEDYEGVMARTINSVYQFGRRSKDLLKFKPFMDDEFEIIGIIQGARYIHDMVFELYTKDRSTTFKAKPEGDFKLKEWYTNNEEDLIGKLGTVKYQRINDETGRPTMVTFKCVKE